VTNQSGAAEKTTFIPAFNDTLSPLRRRRRIGRTPAKRTLGDRTPGDRTLGDRTLGDRTLGDRTLGDRTPGDRTLGLKSAGVCERRSKVTGIKHIDRQPPLNHNDSGGADPARSSYKSDLAFQHAMRCAIARGLENPPIGIVKDHRPLTVPRLFEPVPHSSGCTSPALECADLVARSD
jgi:hypothetical protein